MELLNATNAKKGMRVKLTKPKAHYTIGHGNPAVGSSYECTGTITAVDIPAPTSSRRTIIRVRWDNTRHNSYHSGTLSSINEDVISIWE